MTYLQFQRKTPPPKKKRCYGDKFVDIKVVIRSCNSKKDKQYNIQYSYVPSRTPYYLT